MRWLLLCGVFVTITACGRLPWAAGPVEAGPARPDGPVAAAGQVETPAGVVRVSTFDAAGGPCVRFRFEPADGTEGPEVTRCLAPSGIRPEHQVTGDPATGSPEALNGGGWWAGSLHEGIEYLHWGLAHPEIAEVRLEGPAGAVLATGTLVHAPQDRGLVAYVIASPPGTTSYDVVGVRGDGCVIARERFDATGGAEGPPRSDGPTAC